MSNLKNYYLEPTREQKQGLQDLETRLVYFTLTLKVTSETTVTPKGQKLEAGQCVVGRRTLANECGVPVQQTRTILKNLENLELIKVDSRSIGSIVTILSYRTAKASVKKAPIRKLKPRAEREQEFKNTIYPFISTYGKEMCEEFSNRWTELNKDGKTMRFEKESTWETSRRLKSWSNNAKKWNKDTSQPTKADDHLTNHIMNQLKKGGK